MNPKYKQVKMVMPHCPECEKQLGGNNSDMQPWTCDCGIWRWNGENFGTENRIANYKIEPWARLKE